MSEHAICGPSSLERRAQCPASLRLERAAKAAGLDDANEYSERGTLLHSIVARGIVGAVHEDAAYADLDDWDRCAVEYCLGVVDGLRAEGSRGIESRIDLSFIHPLCDHGTIDYYRASEFGDGVMCDWKFLTQRVHHPVDNWQLKAYAAGLARKYDLGSVRCIVALAHRRHALAHTFARAELDAAVVCIRGIIERCERAVDEFHYSDQCKYCAGAASCPELARLALAIKPASDPESVPPDSVGHLLDLGAPLDIFYRALKRRAYQILEAGGSVCGWRLGPGRSNRAWISGVIDLELQDIVAQYGKAGKDLDIYTKPALKSPAQIEGAIGKSKAARAALAPLIEVKLGNPILEKDDATA